MAGYSQKPLSEKLGIEPGASLLFINAPEEYFDSLGALPKSAKLPSEKSDFIHAFFTELDDLQQQSNKLVQNLAEGGMLWISWPKKSQKILSTTITEQDLRDIFLPLGVVDVKVCAVTDIWSGLKFSWHKK
jgi:hypothetical protein